MELNFFKTMMDIRQEFQMLVGNTRKSVEQVDYVVSGPQNDPGYVNNVIRSIDIAIQHNKAILDFAQKLSNDSSLTTTLQILPIFKQMEEETLAAQKFIYQYQGILSLLQNKG